jgi:hypothetical protein
VVLVHHRGRKSGREYINPMMYLPDDADEDTIYVFATKASAPSNPDWYYKPDRCRRRRHRKTNRDLPRDSPRADR